MWGGISYSIDHANRDMFCYDTDGANFDAASLIAGAIYKGIATANQVFFGFGRTWNFGITYKF